MKGYSCTHKAQYYETDQMGVVHHSNYIRWFEEARVEYLDQIGYPYKKMEEAGVISPVIGIEAQYRSMVRFGDIVSINASIEKFNGIKMDINYVITDTETGDVRTTGKSHHCFLDRDGRPVSLKKSYPDIYAVLAGHEETASHQII